jgi:hypothetical protein
MADLSASQARTVSTTDQVIYNEIDAITRAILAAALAGDLTTTIDDGTTMTESTPIITVTSSGAGAFTPGNTLIIAGETIILGDGVTDGTGIEQAIADINNAGIAGLTATQSGTEIVLAYEPIQASWSLLIDAGTANAELGLTAGTYTATSPVSTEYYSMWSGQSEDRKKSFEFTQVISHFQGLGYNMVAKLNTETSNTIKWELYW